MSKQPSACSFIQERIKQVQKEKGMTVERLAEMMGRDRSTAYNLLCRKSIHTELLYVVSTILDHDFFADLSLYWQQRLRR